MHYDLTTLARRQRNIRRKRIVLRELAPPATFATDLFAIYRTIPQLWIAALPRIEAEYGRTLARMTTDSPADVQAEVERAAGEFDRLFLLLRPELTNWALRLERWTRTRWRGAILSATSVDIETLIGPEDVRETIETFTARNAALVKDVSSQAQGRISDAVFRGLTERKPAREVAAEIREAVAMSRRRSLGIASHQLSDLSNRLADERRREAGLDTWEWLHSRKARPRAEHVARNGKEYTDANAPVDRPGSLPWCGCRSRAVISFD